MYLLLNLINFLTEKHLKTSIAKSVPTERIYIFLFRAKVTFNFKVFQYFSECRSRFLSCSLLNFECWALNILGYIEDKEEIGNYCDKLNPAVIKDSVHSG